MILPQTANKLNFPAWLKPALAVSLLVLVFLLGSAGCAGQKTTVHVPPGESFTLGIGQSSEITGEDLRITFNEVIGDSRCPKNAVCIWSGVVSFQVTLTYRGTAYPLALKQPGLTDQAEDRFFDYSLTFRIDPYPSAGETVKPQDYQLTMTVSK